MKTILPYLIVISTLSLLAHAEPPLTPPIPSAPTQDPLFPDRNQSEQTDAITAETGGIWYNPHHNGEGFIIQINDHFPPQITVTWYTYDVQGQQMWLIGTAEYKHDDNQVVIDMRQPHGTRFGNQFNGSEIIQPSWGTMTFTFNSCAAGVADFDSTQPGIYVVA